MKGLLLPVLVCLVLGLLAWLFVARRRRASKREAQSLTATGTWILGTVMEVWHDADGWHITYEFSPTHSKPPVQRTETFKTVRSKPAEIGDRVTVTYDGAPPYDSRVVYLPRREASVAEPAPET
jgi:hypothetical protein